MNFILSNKIGNDPFKYILVEYFEDLNDFFNHVKKVILKW